MMDYDDMIRVLPPADPAVGGNARIDTKEKKEEEEMKKLTASLLSAALVASLAISGSAFASGTQRSAGDATDGTWDYPWYKTTATAPSYRNEAPASNAVDGNTQTHWHSNWGTGSGTGATTLTDEERYIQLELEKEVEISGVRYLPRQGTDDGVGNGRVTSCKVQVSQTGNEGDPARQLKPQGSRKGKHHAGGVLPAAG